MLETFFYRQLDSKSQTVYRDTVAAVREMKTLVPFYGDCDIQDIFGDIVNNHPHFFYAGVRVEIISGLAGKKLKLQYIYNRCQAENLLTELKRIEKEILSNLINKNQSEYDKVLVLHDYLKTNIRYDYDALSSLNEHGRGYEESYSVIGALIRKKCVCQGFSIAMKALCDQVGIECYVVNGKGNSVLSSGLHAWNIVRINGYYHHVDVTLDNQFSDNIQIPNYGYLNLSDDSIANDHTWDRRFYPKCPEEPYNFFRVNNSLVDSKVQLEKYLYENISVEEPIILFKVKKESMLEKEISGSIHDIFDRAMKKCKYVKVKEYHYSYILEQLVYMVNIQYI